MRVFAFKEDHAAEGGCPGLGGADLRRRVNGIALKAYEMRRGGAADGEASVLISEAIPKGEIEMGKKDVTGMGACAQM
ncbi:hypothetical protein HYE67_009423 [Fusarium culmorum]|uniref:Uncharacterized protein n=1 Tax=Fusarium culmorum TaxID=5516 RepID=A0A2T4H829_FUSCU|nr:hypothetical protein FCULG_00004159 [Fusarium culmorum]QPC67192.1 hypothetical protein HYE67_009423 [Fusarium culmorum]